MKIGVIQNEGDDGIDQNEMKMERDTDKETKKDGKLEILPHKDILKQVSVTISFNLYKY